MTEEKINLLPLTDTEAAALIIVCRGLVNAMLSDDSATTGKWIVLPVIQKILEKMEAMERRRSETNL